jgi:hypothetical protein
MDIPVADCVWNVTAHAQKPDFVFRRNGRVHLNRRGRQFSQLLVTDVCASAVVMLDTPCSEVVWRVLATYTIRQFPLHFPSRASPCAITVQLESTNHAVSRDVRGFNSRQNVIWWHPGWRTGQAPSNPNTAFVNNDVISKELNNHVPPSVFFHILKSMPHTRRILQKRVCARVVLRNNWATQGTVLLPE